MYIYTVPQHRDREGPGSMQITTQQAKAVWEAQLGVSLKVLAKLAAKSTPDEFQHVLASGELPPMELSNEELDLAKGRRHFDRRAHRRRDRGRCLGRHRWSCIAARDHHRRRYRARPPLVL